MKTQPVVLDTLHPIWTEAQLSCDLLECVQGGWVEGSGAGSEEMIVSDGGESRRMVGGDLLGSPVPIFGAERPEPPGRKCLSQGLGAGWKRIRDQDQTGFPLLFCRLSC